MSALDRQLLGHERVVVDAWEVCWEDGGFGKHGNGPFATRGQAVRCLGAYPWPGHVLRVRVEMSADDAARMFARAPKLL